MQDLFRIPEIPRDIRTRRRRVPFFPAMFAKRWHSFPHGLRGHVSAHASARVVEWDTVVTEEQLRDERAAALRENAANLREKGGDPSEERLGGADGLGRGSGWNVEESDLEDLSLGEQPREEGTDAANVTEL